MNKKLIRILNIALLLFLSSCMKEKPHIKLILDKAGVNKVELQKFLNNYKNDSLKLKAAEFLIEGMEDRFSYDLLVKDAENTSVDFNLYHPKINRKNLIYLLDSLHYIVTDTINKDIETLSSEYLIKNHEQAFDMWQNKPWSKNYSYELFCEFILPYRIGNESLDNVWRTYFQNKYLPMLDTLQGNESVRKVFEVIKKDIRTWYGFAFNTIDLKPTQNLDDAICSGKGNCTDLANIYLYALRAIGVAAAIDYIPLWGHVNYGHCELVFWDENNKPVKLQSGYNLHASPPKVYRQYYSQPSNNLFDKVGNVSDIPLHLSDKNYFDVSNEYTNTATVDVIPYIKPENRILYLSVFNAGRWQAIAWSDSIAPETGAFVFKNIGINNIYLPTHYHHNKNIPASFQLMIDAAGRVNTFSVMSDSLFTNMKKNPAVMHKSDFYSRIPDENGRVEAEYLKVNADGGNIQEQSISDFNWSNGSQIWWTDGKPGNKATLKFKIEKDAQYEVKVSLTKAIDYGIFSLKIDGKPGLLSYDAYYPSGVVNSEVSLGIHDLGIGEHTLEITITGANPSAVKGYMFGADYLDFVELTTHLAEWQIGENTINVFPNPFSDIIRISGLTFSKPQQYCIYTIGGQKFLSGIIGADEKNVEIDTSSLLTGIYILSIGESFRTKIIK